MKTHLYFIIALLIATSLCGCGVEKHAEDFEAIEITGAENDTTIIRSLQTIGISDDESYQWKNHFVVFSSKEKIDKVYDWAKNRYTTKRFNSPFYRFNRQQLTGETPAQAWDNVILTANLVADSTLQNEYMEYHRTQFEKWPEVSNGFTNAQFQQLLVFRNGRQLLLVISLPKGKTLDELNPKTTENNPRINEWNSLMSRYQEGIEDAPKGTVWVMFKSTAP